MKTLAEFFIHLKFSFLENIMKTLAEFFIHLKIFSKTYRDGE